MRESDVITLHVPLTPTTRHMINREARALPTWRPAYKYRARRLIDSSALIEALDSGQVAGVGLDVLEDERVFRGGATQVLSEKIAERVGAQQAQ